MNINFSYSKLKNSYSGAGISIFIRDLSDLYSRVHCNKQEAEYYAIKQTKGCCLYCGKKLYKLSDNIPVFEEDYHWDHIQPASLGGLYTIGNVCLACSDCNLAKSNENVFVFYNELCKINKAKNYDNFEKFMDNYMKPYKDKYPDMFKNMNKDKDTIDLNKLVKNILISNIDFNRIKKLQKISRWESSNSVNLPFYKYVQNYIDNSNYSVSRKKTYRYKISSFDEEFTKTFSADRDIKDLSIRDLNTIFYNLLEKQVHSRDNFYIQKAFLNIILDCLFYNLEVIDNFNPSKNEFNCTFKFPINKNNKHIS